MVGPRSFSFLLNVLLAVYASFLYFLLVRLSVWLRRLFRLLYPVLLLALFDQLRVLYELLFNVLRVNLVGCELFILNNACCFFHLLLRFFEFLENVLVVQDCVRKLILKCLLFQVLADSRFDLGHLQ